MLKDLNLADNLLFDLDGTLSDNSDGIIGGVMYALDKYGIPYGDRESLKKFIGPPLTRSFEEHCGFSRAEALEIIEVYREYFRERGIFENVLYDGVPEMLAELKTAGKKLFIATSKPEPFARRIAEKFGINGFFEYICGSELDGSRELKSDVITFIIEKFGLKRDRTLMIGDRHHDIEGALKCGISSMGVLYGFGSREELTSAGAGWLAESPGDVREKLLQ